MEFIILAGALVFGFAFGWTARERYAMRVVKELLRESAQLEQDNAEPRTKMRLERHGEVIYAYTTDGDEFIAQGRDLEELDKAIVERFPGKKFSVQEQNLVDIKAEYHESV